ncbi:MAG: iron ABC transporter permease [Actinomycetota bacterium]|nr:iron ABC transporter permease [Actinomycetota bacterium]
MATVTVEPAHERYRGYTRRKVLVIAAVVVLTLGLAVLAMTLGSAGVSPLEVLKALTGQADERTTQIVINIRLVRVLAAIVAGVGLSVGGCIMQGTLRNPLASDYTLGISQGAAFGAAVAIVAMGAGSVQSTGADAVLIKNPYVVTMAAFGGALAATLGILILAKYKGVTPEAMILAGVAFGSLFTAGTVLTQYFANDVQVASIVFWTFGDIGRASWQELAIMTAFTLPITAFFILNRWNYNALESGDDTAKSMGVNVGRTRMVGMFLASLVTAVAVSFLGIIAFLGLVSPHIMRRMIGSDYRYLIPGSCAMGVFILLASDTVSRTIIAPIVLPVGAITSFMGAPLFLYILIRGYRRT